MVLRRAYTHVCLHVCSGEWWVWRATRHAVSRGAACKQRRCMRACSHTCVQGYALPACASAAVPAHPFVVLAPALPHAFIPRVSGVRSSHPPRIPLASVAHHPCKPGQGHCPFGRSLHPDPLTLHPDPLVPSMKVAGVALHHRGGADRLHYLLHHHQRGAPRWRGHHQHVQRAEPRANLLHHRHCALHQKGGCCPLAGLRWAC